MDMADAHSRVTPAERAGIIGAACSADMLVNFPLCAPPRASALNA